MTMYRVSVIDREGVVARSMVTDSIRGAAALLVALGSCTREPWAQPLLDEHGELTAEIRAEGGRILNTEEGMQLLGAAEELGSHTPTDGNDLGRLRWGGPEVQS